MHACNVEESASEGRTGQVGASGDPRSLMVEAGLCGCCVKARSGQASKVKLVAFEARGERTSQCRE